MKTEVHLATRHQRSTIKIYLAQRHQVLLKANHTGEPEMKTSISKTSPSEEKTETKLEEARKS